MFSNFCTFEWVRFLFYFRIELSLHYKCKLTLTPTLIRLPGVVTEAQNSNSKFKLELELMINPNFWFV